MAYAAVLAGGIGSRMGNKDLPKQYMTINGKPILVRSVEQFVKHPEIDYVLVLTPSDWVDYTKDLLQEYHLYGDVPLEVISGGASRNDTLYNAISFLEDRFTLTEDAVFVTHDAVRPFVTETMISANIAAVKEHGACGTCIPSTDTIVVSPDGLQITDIPDRSNLYQMQTPQSFRPLTLKALMDSLTPEEAEVLTDGCKIYLLKGQPVVFVPGDVTNIKITYPSDLTFAEHFAAEVDA